MDDSHCRTCLGLPGLFCGVNFATHFKQSPGDTSPWLNIIGLRDILSP
jgi:hypothetical protein